MTKYYYKVQGKQFGPLELEQLKGKNITANTPVWYEPLPKWTIAGQVPELKEIIDQTPVAAPVAAAATAAVVNEPAIKEYFYKEGSKQVGPFTFDQMKAKALAPKTPVWYNPLPKWVTAEEVAELIPFLIVPAPKTEVREVPKVVAPVAEVVMETATAVADTKEQAKMSSQVIETPKEEQKAQPVITEKPVKSTTTTTISVANTSSVAAAATAPVPAVKLTQKPPKKGNPWVTGILSVLVLAGAGYFVYQDMEKNKKKTEPVQITNATTNATANAPVSTTDQGKTDVVSTTNTPIETSPSNNASVEPTSSTTKTNKPVTVPVTNKTDKRTTTANSVNSAEEDKTKKAAAATAAREAEVRNHWQNYISFGRFDYKAHALKGIDPFFIPVINNSDYMLDQVTVWVDYIKKGGGVHKSETITINNIPPHSTLLGKANGNSRGSSVKTVITAISCKKIHFCYPQNNGTADPFYCK